MGFHCENTMLPPNCNCAAQAITGLVALSRALHLGNFYSGPPAKSLFKYQVQHCTLHVIFLKLIRMARANQNM